MPEYELLDDLYAYSDWANRRVLQLCEGLSDEQLDAPRDIGFGTLRATLFHLLAADEVWMERWEGVPWRPFPTDPQGMDLDAIKAALSSVSLRRRQLIDRHRAERWQEIIEYQDSKQTDYSHTLYDLLLHVANHGVHHRAQALHYLKGFQRTVPAGLDYIFYRIAATGLEQSPETVEALETFGMEVATLQVPEPTCDPSMIHRLLDYSEWANAEVLSMCRSVGGDVLDRDFEMGAGSIRGVLLHLWAVEQWWSRNWAGEDTPFPRLDPSASLEAIESGWEDSQLACRRVIEKMDQADFGSVITVKPGGPPTRFRVGPTILQVLLHATHHRAQLINMLRRGGGTIHNVDILYWPALSESR